MPDVLPPLRRYQQAAQNKPLSSDASPLPVPLWSIALVLILILALGAWWFTQPQGVTDSPAIVSPTPIASASANAAALPDVTALTPQTISLGDASVTVRQKTETTPEGRTETLLFSSDTDTTFYVLYVVPKETYATATELMTENPDFQDAIVLDEDPVLVVPVVLKAGENKKHEMRVPAGQSLAFIQVQLTQEYSLTEMQQIGRILQDQGLLKIAAQDVSKFQKSISETLNGGGSKEFRMNQLVSLFENSVREKLQEVALTFTLARPFNSHNLDLIDLGKPTHHLDDFDPDVRGAIELKETLSEVTADGLTRTRYSLRFDFSKYVSKHGRLPFNEFARGNVTYSFAEAPGIFKIPITLRNVATRRALSDYAFTEDAFVLDSQAGLSLVAGLNHFPMDLEFNTPCVAPSEKFVSHVGETGEVAEFAITPVAGCSTAFGTRVFQLPPSVEASVSGVFPPTPDVVSYSTAPKYLLGCTDSLNVVQGLYEDLFSDLLSSSASSSGDVFLTDEQNAVVRASTIIHYVDASEDTCSIALQVPADSKRVVSTLPDAQVLENGYSYVVSIYANPPPAGSDVDESFLDSVAPRLKVEKLPGRGRWTYVTQDGVFSDDASSKEVFLAYAHEMSEAVKGDSS